MKRSSQNLGLAIAVLFLTGGCIPAKLAIIPAITGRVVDQAGLPVASAAVEYSRTPLTMGPTFCLQLTTDQSGRFAYAGRTRWVLHIVPGDPVPDSVRLQAHATGGMSGIKQVSFMPQSSAFGTLHPYDVGDLHLSVLSDTP